MDEMGDRKMKGVRAMEYLNMASDLGIVPGLETIRELLLRVGEPQKKIKVIHIAGTNGKGSVGAFISYMLAAAGYKVGRFVSPAVIEQWEIIQILKKKEGCGENKDLPSFLVSYIAKSEAAAHIERLQAVCDSGDRILKPTAFELETAAAFLEFEKQKVDIAVLECGMGGALDATNIAENVVCSVITPVSMDHMAFLGNTLKEIAQQKAGIIRQGIPVVSAVQHRTVRKVLEDMAERQGTELFFAEIESARNVRHNIDGVDFLFCRNWEDGQTVQVPVHLPLLGIHQTENALTALEVIHILNGQGEYQISVEHALEGIAKTVWRGRFEILARRPLVIVDGAHNAAAAVALRRSIECYLFQKGAGISVDNLNLFVDNIKENQQFCGKLIYVMGIFRDKDVDAVIEETMDLANLVFTVTPDSPRGLEDKELAQKIQAYGKRCDREIEIIPCGKVENGIGQAISRAGKEDAIVIFGSLSLLRKAYQFFKLFPAKGWYKFLPLC